MPCRPGFAAAVAVALALRAVAMPPGDPSAPSVPGLIEGLRDARPEVRARCAAALVSDERREAADAVGRILVEGDPAEAREILLFLCDRPAERFAGPLSLAMRRAPLAQAAEEAMDCLGRRRPGEALARLREELERAALEERAPFIAALGYVRTEQAIPTLIALLSSRDSEAASAALRRITTLPYTEPRDWNFWWDRRRDMTLEEIVRESARRLRDENAALRAALDRETARANELEKAGLKERLRAAREKKDLAAEKAILEKHFASPVTGLRSWAVEETRQALKPDEFLPAVLKLLAEDPVPAVRVAAAKSAGLIGRDRAVEALRRCLDDELPAIRVAAVDALTEAAGEKAAPDIERMLDPAQARSVREAAITALKVLRPRGFAASASRLLETELGRPPQENVAAGLVELLGALRDEEGLPALVRALSASTDKNVRFRAVKALGEIGSLKAFAPLVAEIDRPDAGQAKDIVAEAVAALASLGGEDVRLRLEKLLGEFLDHDNPNPKARENAARGLARAGTLASVDPLLRCAKSDPDGAVRKEAWASALALCDAAAARLEALEGLLAKIGDAEADAPWRIVVRTVLVKPGNFEPARVKGHVRPLADDCFAQKDWSNALKWYGEAVALNAEDTASAARAVTCQVRSGDLKGAIERGAPLVARLAPGAPGFAEARLALIEARSQRGETGRAFALCPEDGALAVLPAADREALASERKRLEPLCREIVEKLEKRFPAVAAGPEEGWKEYVELLRSAPPAAAVGFLAGRAESAEAAEKAAAGRALEALTGIAVPAEEGDARRAALESVRAWPSTLTP